MLNWYLWLQINLKIILLLNPKGNNVSIVYVNGFLKDLHSTSNFDMKGKIINDVNQIKPLGELKVKELQYYIDNGKL